MSVGSVEDTLSSLSASGPKSSGSPPLRLLRLFIALETNAAMQQAIDAAQQAVRRRGDMPVRWTNPAQAHLTLQFLGNVVAERVPALVEAVKPAVVQHHALFLRAGEVGAF